MYNLRHSTATLVWYLIIYVMLVSCGQKPAKISLAERKAMDSIVSSSRNIDTLSMIQKRMEREGNMLGSIVAYRAMGKELRNDSRFDEALKVHSEGLKQAETLGDTLEIVQALNNIGTVYRRMGMLDMAQDYHYRAFAISKESADTSFTAKKNRVVSLNGLGNIYLTLGNYARADSALRLALAGERELNSALGQAINYANIGSIFSHREQLDSAWRYYRQSMGLNLQVGNTLGVALCHIYFGELHEKEHDYEKAISEYDKAYQQLQSSQDEWHAMNPLIALAGIYTQMGNDTKAQEYLDKALHSARAINSHEHLAEVYNLYYKLYKRKGNYSAALTAHEKAAAMEGQRRRYGETEPHTERRTAHRTQHSGSGDERGQYKPEERTVGTIHQHHRLHNHYDNTDWYTGGVLLRTAHTPSQPPGPEKPCRNAREFLYKHHP